MGRVDAAVPTFSGHSGDLCDLVQAGDVNDPAGHRCRAQDHRRRARTRFAIWTRNATSVEPMKVLAAPNRGVSRRRRMAAADNPRRRQDESVDHLMLGRFGRPPSDPGRRGPVQHRRARPRRPTTDRRRCHRHLLDLGGTSQGLATFRPPCAELLGLHVGSRRGCSPSPALMVVHSKASVAARRVAASCVGALDGSGAGCAGWHAYDSPRKARTRPVSGTAARATGPPGWRGCPPRRMFRARVGTPGDQRLALVVVRESVGRPQPTWSNGR